MTTLNPRLSVASDKGISFPSVCSHCGQGPDWCQCQPTLPEGDGTPGMTEPHNCPFTLGQLMALYAIVAVAGDQPKARLLLEHAREHQSQTQEES